MSPAPAMGTNACPTGSTSNKPQADKSLVVIPLSESVTPVIEVPAPLTEISEGYGEPVVAVFGSVMAPHCRIDCHSPPCGWSTPA